MALKNIELKIIVAIVMIAFFELCECASYPGTKWCGPGNDANHYWDLGTQWETDMCCREHDYCPDTIGAFGFKHGLWNFDLVTALHCSCDAKFRRCLHAVGNDVADSVGRAYFDYLLPLCFAADSQGSYHWYHTSWY